MASSQPEIEIASKQLVKPSNPTPNSLRHLHLSFLDQHQNFNLNYIPLIFCYQNDQFPPNIQRSHQLKQSLSETLTTFYPFAGRIFRNASIDCDDSGALYIEARVDARLSEAIQNATPKDLDRYLPVHTCPDPWSCTERSNLVLLAVQISFFECGGMAVGVRFSHVLGDFNSLVAFMKVWAQKCRSSTTETICMQPNFDMGFNHFPPLDVLKNLFGDPAEDKLFMERFELGNEKLPSLENKTEENRVITKRFVFDESILSEMKQLVSSKSSCDNPSRVETVSAFIWKHFIDVSRAKTTKRAFEACLAVNMRPRITPPLPGFAIGNLAVVTWATWESENGTQDYLDLVPPVRTAIRNVDESYLNNEQKRWEYVGVQFSPDQEDKEHHYIISWCKFPCYEVDYGWGKPLTVCTPGWNSKNAAILMDTRSGDGIQAWITMEEDQMAMLPDEFLALESNDFTN